MVTELGYVIRIEIHFIIRLDEMKSLLSAGASLRPFISLNVSCRRDSIYMDRDTTITEIP